MKWGKWTLRIIVWGLFIIFVAAIGDYFLRNRELSIELKIFGALQIWVGFALGIIAMLFSIISMYLSFYNLELQKDAEKNNLETFNSLKINIVNEIKNEVCLELKEIRKDMLEHFGVLESQNKNINNLVIENINDRVVKKFDTTNSKKITEESEFYGEMSNEQD